MSAAADWLPVASDEDAEIVWVRRDLAGPDAIALLDGWGIDVEEFVLTGGRDVVMVRAFNGYGEPWLWEADAELEHDDAAVYVRYCVELRDDVGAPA